MKKKELIMATSESYRFLTAPSTSLAKALINGQPLDTKTLKIRALKLSPLNANLSKESGVANEVIELPLASLIRNRNVFVSEKAIGWPNGFDDQLIFQVTKVFQGGKEIMQHESYSLTCAELKKRGTLTLEVGVDGERVTTLFRTMNPREYEDFKTLKLPEESWCNIS